VEVIDSTGKKIEEQKQRGGPQRADAGLRFRLKPQERGLNFYQVRAMTRAEGKGETNAAKSAEATLANNSRAAVVDRGARAVSYSLRLRRPNGSSSSSTARWRTTISFNWWR